MKSVFQKVLWQLLFVVIGLSMLGISVSFTPLDGNALKLGSEAPAVTGPVFQKVERPEPAEGTDFLSFLKDFFFGTVSMAGQNGPPEDATELERLRHRTKHGEPGKIQAVKY